MAIAADQQHIRHARENLLNGSSLDGCFLPPTVAQSWSRCRELGLDAEHRPRIEALSSSELSQACEQNEILIRLCRPELEGLRGEARRTSSVVVLTDSNGLILDRLGDASFANKAARLSLQPGVAWTEHLTGTNAIGTALVEGRAVGIEGNAHYFSSHHILSCYAAPIVDPFGRTLGTLDLSGPSEVAHTHALGMIRLAVDQIERRLFMQDFNDAIIVRVHPDRSMIGSFREGILVFRDGCLIAANRVALHLFRLEYSTLRKHSFEALFGCPLPHTRAQSNGVHLVTDGRGRELFLQLQHPQASATTRDRNPAAPQTAAKPPFDSIVFNTQLQRELDRACAMLDGDLPILVQGETGAGKEVFARHLHAQCSRFQQPFVAINCAAIPESLIESELFGYAEGAFTGARRKGAEGLLQKANGGVLFLDEIGDMPLRLQSRLLRVLQEREVTPLGGGKSQKLDIALVCATHRDLPRAIEAGDFRADLYYRIAQYTLTLPSLREHPNLDELVTALWENLSAQPALPPNIQQALSRYHWPGNYRQLNAVLQRLSILSQRGYDIGPSDLPNEVLQNVGASIPKSSSLQDTTDQKILTVLEECGGNVSQAARKLGINRSTIYRRVVRHC